MGKPGVHGGLDEKIPENVPVLDKTSDMIKDKIVKSREQIYAESTFEWVKTERSGDLSVFQHLEVENGVEYVVFQDNSRIRVDLLGDIVLMHQNPNEIVGNTPTLEQSNANYDRLTAGLKVEETRHVQTTLISHQDQSDPVVAILEKTKKKTEKITITLSLKIPSPEIYNVVKDNFDNTDDILLQNVMEQIQNDLLKEALKKELQIFYQKKKKA
jgi:hypothetical protein